MKCVFATVGFMVLLASVAPAQTTNYLFDSDTDSNAVIAVGNGGTILRSTNGGLSWDVMPSGSGETLNGVSMSASHALAVGYTSFAGSGIYRSVNSGDSWTSFTRTTEILQGVSDVDGTVAYVVGNKGTIMRTSDGGGLWVTQSVPAGFPIDIDGRSTDLWDVEFVDSAHGIAVGKQGSIIQTTDGQSWALRSSGTTQPLTGVCFASSTVAAVVGYGGVILRTTNGGSSWSLQSSPVTSILNGVCFTDASNGIAVGETATILRTTNGGSSWAIIPKPGTIPSGTTLYSVSFSNASTGIITGSSGIILRTADGGASWVQVAPSTNNPPASPALSLPADGATSQPTSVTLSWNPSVGATSYRLQVSTNSAFSPLMVDDAALSSTSRLVAGLANSTVYYWRVNASNSFGTSAWSGTRSFTTAALSSDTTPPTCSISSPSNGATVSGTVSIAASASDNVGVSRVDVLVDGVLLGSDASSPYAISWNTTSVANGSHTLLAKAYDASGNVGASQTVSVTVANGAADTAGPTMAFQALSSGQTVSGKVTINVSANDPSGVARVEFYVNGTLKSTDSAAPYSYSWNSRSYKGQTVTISAKGFDLLGNVTTISISVMVR